MRDYEVQYLHCDGEVSYATTDKSAFERYLADFELKNPEKASVTSVLIPRTSKKHSKQWGDTFNSFDRWYPFWWFWRDVK